MQHGRITDPGPAILSDPRSVLIQRRIDVDLFVVSLHRLHTVARLAAEVADPGNVLSAALEQFSDLTAGLPLSESEPDQPATIASVRNFLEHSQNLAIRGGLGLASGTDGWWISYRDRMFQTRELLTAAEEMHHAVRAAVDPEAFSDFHGITRSSNCATRRTSPDPGAPAPTSAGKLRRWPGYKPACADLKTRHVCPLRVAVGAIAAGRQRGPVFFRHVGSIASLLGALVGGLAAIGGAWLQARSTARLQREEAARQEEQRQEERRALLQDRRQILARRYLFQLGDAVDSLRHRVDNWANRGGLEYSEGRFPGYWEVTSLYAVARALGAGRILDLEGVYVELRAVSPDEAGELPRHAVEQAVTKAFGFFRYHRMALAEAVLDRSGDEFRLLIYSEFLRRYKDPEWNLESLLEPVRQALNSPRKERFKTLEQSLISLSASITHLTTSPKARGDKAPNPAQHALTSSQSALQAPGANGA